MNEETSHGAGQHSPCKRLYFLVEALNSFGATYLACFFYFFTNARFGFGVLENLLVSAFNGLLYLVLAWQAGRLAQRHGYLKVLRWGLILMLISTVAGCFSQSQWVFLFLFSMWMVGMCGTWPSLEALVSEGESRSGLQRRIGMYNVVWAATAAVAYFSGGALFEKLGWISLFWIPAMIHVLQLIVVQHLLSTSGEPSVAVNEAADSEAELPQSSSVDQKIREFFRWAAWLANPLAYVAMNTIIPLIPALTQKLKLSPVGAGVVCSIWLFARLLAFAILWRWSGWHYRFGLLLMAYAGLVSSFMVIFLVNNLWSLCLAQIVFGLATGLIYYSSLFYSMDSSETMGEHGGLHEAAIGAGFFLGPAIAATGSYLVPSSPNAGIIGVALFLFAGMCVILGRYRHMRVRAC